MARNPQIDWPLLMRILADDALSLEEKLLQIQQCRAQADDEEKARLDRLLLEQYTVVRQGLLEAKNTQKRLREILDKLTATPWHPALFLQAVPTPQGLRAIVHHGSSRRVVGVADGVDLNAIGRGDEVMLASELNVIVALSPLGAPRHGEAAVFDRRLADGRLVLKWRDEEQIVEAAAALKTARLKSGDLVRYDRTAWIAFEVIERSDGAHLFLEETPAVTFDDIGGLGPQIDRIKHSIDLHLFHADTVRKYRLRRKGSVLLIGPVGVGKTMVAKALANWLGQLSPAGRSRFINVKPSSLNSMWYGQSESNYREVFRVAREAGAAEPGVPVVLFFDEIDSGGMARGLSHQHVDDRVLNAFMAELDGFVARDNVLVVAATNRRELLDPGLLRPGRLGDLVLAVPRPKMNAGREIFAKYLPPDIPYALNGHGSDVAAAREELLNAAVSSVYAPNAGTELATITFRDGKQRTVRSADLVSGAIIANVVSAATERACLREVNTGEAGLRWDDLQWAIAEQFETVARALTPASCRSHLTDLPQDLDVVRVEPIVRKSARPGGPTLTDPFAVASRRN